MLIKKGDFLYCFCIPTHGLSLHFNCLLWWYEKPPYQRWLCLIPGICVLVTLPCKRCDYVKHLEMGITLYYPGDFSLIQWFLKRVQSSLLSSDSQKGMKMKNDQRNAILLAWRWRNWDMKVGMQEVFRTENEIKWILPQSSRKNASLLASWF
jgi:hypothetical protein